MNSYERWNYVFLNSPRPAPSVIPGPVSPPGPGEDKEQAPAPDKLSESEEGI